MRGAPVAPLAGLGAGAVGKGTHGAECCSVCCATCASSSSVDASVDGQGEGQRRAVVPRSARSIDDGKTWGRTKVGADRIVDDAFGGVEEARSRLKRPAAAGHLTELVELSVVHGCQPGQGAAE